MRDIAASLAEGLTRHLADVRRRLPGVTRLVVQVDEPLLAAVVAGELSTASGWGRLRSFEQVGRGGRAAPGPRFERTPTRHGDGRRRRRGLGAASRLDGALLRDAGAEFIGIDGAVLDTVDEDEIGEAIDAGVGLLVACGPLDAAAERSSTGRWSPSRSLWKRLGFRVEQLSRTVALTPVEGLERLDTGAVAAVLKRTVEAARYLDEFAAEETS